MINTPATSEHDTAQIRGRALVLLSGGFWSIAGVGIRLIDTAGAWQILFYRSFTLTITVFTILAVRNRATMLDGFRIVGATGVVTGLFMGFASIGYIFSVLHTTVANTLFLGSTAPFMTAILAWFILGERVRRVTWIAMIGAALGVAIMVSGGFAAGTMFGDLLALGTALCYACFTVALRRSKAIDMLPACCLGGVFSAIIAGVMAMAIEHGLAITVHDLVICIILGVATGFGFLLFTIGSRHVPAAELTLLTFTEVVLGPIWVWIAVGEVPSTFTFIGGGIVLAAITWLTLTGMRRQSYGDRHAA